MLPKCSMFAVLLSSAFLLSACNEDDDAQQSGTSTRPSNIIIIAHRGASALRPEHTLAAYQQAMDDGADFIEPDLVATQDGFLIARHENEMSGTTNVSDLVTFAGRKTRKLIDANLLNGWFSEDFSLAEIKQLKARERIPELRPDNTAYNDQFDIPTLEEIIELAYQNYLKTGKVVGLYIETKHPTYFQQLDLALEQRLLNSLATHRYTRDIAPIYIQSFEVDNLKWMRQQQEQRKLLAHVEFIQLLGDKVQKPFDQRLHPFINYGYMATAQGLTAIAQYADGVGPSKDYILENKSGAQPTQFISNAHKVSLKVHPYTLRPENNFLNKDFQCNATPQPRCDTGAIQEYQAFYQAGVDGIFTDDPGLGRQALKLHLNTKQ